MTEIPGLNIDDIKDAAERCFDEFLQTLEIPPIGLNREHVLLIFTCGFIDGCTHGKDLAIHGFMKVIEESFEI